MEAKRCTIVKVNDGVLYFSGYTLIVTETELEKLVTWLKDRKAVASQVIDTMLRDHLQTTLEEGDNFVNLTTFAEIESRCSQFIKKPFKTSANRYIRVIIKKGKK